MGKYLVSAIVIICLDDGLTGNPNVGILSLIKDISSNIFRNFKFFLVYELP